MRFSWVTFGIFYDNGFDNNDDRFDNDLFVNVNIYDLVNHDSANQDHHYVSGDDNNNQGHLYISRNYVYGLVDHNFDHRDYYLFGFV